MDKRMKIAVTGSSGFIGSALVESFLRQGHSVVLMQRKAPTSLSVNCEYLHFDLRNPQFPDPDGLTAIVHCAVMARTQGDSDAEEVNIHATLALRDFCRAHGIRFVFLSSMSAHKEAESVYGRHKFRLEQMMVAPNETVLKLGLVVGASGGLFQRISSAMAGSPVIPMVDGGGQPIQTVAVEEVCDAVVKVVDEGISGHFLFGSEEVLTMRQLYTAIGSAQGRRPRFVPVPYFIVATVLGLLALLPLKLPVSNENLLGLKHLRTFDTAPDLKQLGVTLQPLEQVLNIINEKRTL